MPIKDLVPLSEDSACAWEPTGPKPEFRLSGPLPKGWVRVSFAASSGKPRQFKLYSDAGEGVSQTQCFALGSTSDSEECYSVTVPLGSHVAELRLDPGDGPSRFVIKELKLTHVAEIEIVVRTLFSFFRKRQCLSLRALYPMAQRAYGVFKTGGYREFRNSLRQLAKSVIESSNSYDRWIKWHTPGEEELRKMGQIALGFRYKPLFSIVVPVYNVEERWLRKFIDSVLAQVYPYWELCLADDASSKPHVRNVLQEYQAFDRRVKVIFRDKNGHISAATNSALSLATGDFMCLMDHDDEIAPDALFDILTST
jgi:hypothetical protein